MFFSGDLKLDSGDGVIKASSENNHHGESPFSNSDSVGSFPDKPTDFASAYTQLYQRYLEKLDLFVKI